MAKKANKSRAGKRAPASKLPKGYTAISGYGSSWPGDRSKGAVLEGKLTGIKTVTQEREVDGKKKKVKVLVASIVTAKGEEFNVWESAGTVPLFKQKKGASIYMRFDGFGAKKKGRNPPRLYTIGAK